MAHSIGVHQSVFVRDTTSATTTLLNNTYSVITAGGDRPVKFTEGSIVQFLAPIHTGFETNAARLHINVGDTWGASDDVTADIRQLDGGGAQPWGDFLAGRRYLVVYFNAVFWPLDISLLTGPEVDTRVLDILADAVTGNVETGSM